MNRIDRILENKLFLENMEKNNTAEAQRRFCRHNMGHFLDVARIATIISLEEKIDINREIIYAAALLHDIGKHMQYSENIPHEIASANIAPEILKACDFSSEEIEEIVTAICNHRNADIVGNKDLSGLLYRADKASRACFACEASEDCNWKGDKKNLNIKY